MRACQPGEELRGGVVGRRPVERHQCGRHTGLPDDVGAPASLVDRLDFDQIRSTADVFFETVNGTIHRW